MDAQKIVDAVDSVMAEMLGKKVWQALKYHIAEVHSLDASDPDAMVDGSESFEKILTELLGAGAVLIFRQINQKLAEAFSIEPEKFAYSQSSDYSSLIGALKAKDAEKYDVKEKKDVRDDEPE